MVYLSLVENIRIKLPVLPYSSHRADNRVKAPFDKIGPPFSCGNARLPVK